MLIRTSRSKNDRVRSQFQLRYETWDDWFEFSTLFSLSYYPAEGYPISIGSIKIGKIGLGGDQSRPDIPDEFDSLAEEFFSIGQDVSYYENLNSLGADLRNRLLSAVNDIAYSEAAFDIARKERVTKISLFRYVTESSILGQFRRLALGNSELSEYNFEFIAPKHSKSSVNEMVLSFQVTPNAFPPSNVHVIIGRNGVGKTHLLNNMTDTLLNPSRTKFGKFQFGNGDGAFANLVSVTYSAFDDAEPQPERKDKTTRLRYSYIGLKRESSDKPKTPRVLKNEFVRSLEDCRRVSKASRWKTAVRELESDNIFAEAEISKLVDFEGDQFNEKSSAIFNKLSSGHKIVLLSLTRLVETVEERSLVLIDEPESHLHPPLLSAYIRAVSNLLIQRNGVAIIATHSPVVLQEVPLSCIHRMRRIGANARVDRLETQSFGENIGILTREVFGLEVTDSGFHKMLSRSVEEFDDFEEILGYYNYEVGIEGRALLLTMLNNKLNDENNS